ncbi:MAG: hypothetical protein IJC59_08090, partial [Lachnospiraceae bacterium]|nr:hypothetical protein [Lachnospiraceae bacterium]
ARVLTWGLASCFRLKDYEMAEQMVAGEQEYMLMAMLQNWYTDATEEQREAWKAGFEGAVNAIRSSGRESLYPRLLQTFRAVTLPPGAEEAQPAQPTQAAPPPKPTPKPVTLTPELTAMADQLREKVPVLIQVGELQTALVMVKQLLQFYPEDQELLQWEKELGSSL